VRHQLVVGVEKGFSHTPELHAAGVELLQVAMVLCYACARETVEALEQHNVEATPGGVFEQSRKLCALALALASRLDVHVLLIDGPALLLAEGTELPELVFGFLVHRRDPQVDAGTLD
jgi:hypothetical protein